jgi:hypothetical protein
MQETDATSSTSLRLTRLLVALSRRRSRSSLRRRVLLDVDVALRDVRLGLVVVVVADEVADGVVREQLLELLVELAASVLLCEKMSVGRARHGDGVGHP